MTLKVTAQPGIVRSERSLLFPYNPSPFPLLVFVAASCGLVPFVLLQLHNQSQAEYLIFYDYWRNFAAWKNQTVSGFFFHNVHTWVVISAIWFLDVLLVAGNLKLLHAYVAAANLLAFCSIFLILRRADQDRQAPLSVTIISVVATAALWLSPSNSTTFIYPCNDVEAASALLMISLSEISYRWSEDSRRTSLGRLIIYALASLLGFLTLETFLFVPLFYGLDAWLRGRIRYVVSASAIFAILFLTYMFCLLLGLIGGAHIEMARAPFIVAHNFLVLLSSQFGFLLAASGVSQQTAANLSICVSIIQILCFVCFALFYYRQPAQRRSSFRFQFALASFALTAVFLATWLRFGNQTIFDPVDRYTWYSELFSIAVFLQARDLWRTSKNRRHEAASIVIFALCAAYLLGEQAALLLRSHNVAAWILDHRLEMAVYASAPGNELVLGPQEPDGGMQFRGDLHDFLQDRGLSVFGSAGYESLGTKIFGTSEPTSHTSCTRVAQTASPRRDFTLYFMSFEGVEDGGVFVVTDRNNIVTNFSFARRAMPFDRTVVALLPSTGPGHQAVYFVKFRSGKEITAVRCG